METISSLTVPKPEPTFQSTKRESETDEKQHPTEMGELMSELEEIEVIKMIEEINEIEATANAQIDQLRDAINQRFDAIDARMSEVYQVTHQLEVTFTNGMQAFRRSVKPFLDSAITQFSDGMSLVGKPLTDAVAGSNEKCAGSRIPEMPASHRE
jgi:hypothetical protein